MKHNTKIATCSYCGTRAALVLTGETRHELACSSCGAPLHDLKRLRSDRPGARDEGARPKGGPGAARPRRKVGKKPRKTLGRRLLTEAFDLLEDIFD